jgi:hypothetical protein
VTDAIGTSFYPLNGQIDSELAVTFFVTIKNLGDKVYLFKGRVEGTEERSMKGRFRIVEIDHANEDGNWSAQAQGGGDDDDRPKPKPRPRHSR